MNNVLGDMLGYARCSYSNITFFRNRTVSVYYTPSRGHLFVKKGVANLSDKQLINLTKQIVQPTFEDLEELKNNPNFKMNIQGRVKVMINERR